jgi:hypothetical protein
MQQISLIEVWAETIFETLDRFETKNFMLYQEFCKNKYFVSAVSGIIGILLSAPSQPQTNLISQTGLKQLDN